MKNKIKFSGSTLLFTGVFFLFASSCDSGSGSFTDPRDGNIYQTKIIGHQEWMVENLRYLPGVAEPDKGSRTTAYYYVYGYNGTDVSAAKATKEYDIYGVLYNWQAATDACPDGWHLPDDDEWGHLTDYLRDAAAGKLKATGNIEEGTGLWAQPNIGATNETGFTALPGGIRHINGDFIYLGSDGAWWSATENSADDAWSRSMINLGNNVTRNYYYKDFGFSVRCLRY